MRLTIINQFYVPDLSPTAHLSASLAEYRAAQGDTVTVVTSKGGYVPASRQQAIEDKSRNPRVYRVWTPQLGKGNVLKRCIDYASFYALAKWRMLRLPRQDVIISLTTPPFIAWTAVLHKILHPSTKLILWNMDCYPELAERSDKLRRDGFLSRLMRRANRALFRRIDHLVCLDTAMVELLCSQYSPSADRPPVTVIPNWEQASFFPAEMSPPKWSKADELNLNGKFVIAYIGNMGHGHRFETVLDVAEAIKDEPIVFLFVGGGTHFDPVQQAAKERGLTNIVMHGYVPKDQTPSLLGSSHASLITLRDEILGVMSPSKLHSCLAMSLPIVYIGPTKSNVDDCIRQFGCGISCRHGDVDGAVKFIRELARDHQRHETLRKLARKAFDEAYCDTRTLPQFDAIIDGLAAPAKRPSSASTRADAQHTTAEVSPHQR